MATTFRMDSADQDGSLILDLTKRPSKLFADSMDSFGDEDWDDNKMIICDDQGATCRSVPIISTHSLENNDVDKTLPFKKRRSYFHPPFSDSCFVDVQRSLPIVLDHAELPNVVLDLRRQIKAASAESPMDLQTKPCQKDGLNALVENMAAMHTEPRQHQIQRQSYQPNDVKSAIKYGGQCGSDPAVFDSSTLRGRGLYVMEPVLAETAEGINPKESQGRRLSINISPSPVLSQLDDTGCSNIDVSEEECSLAKKPDEDGDLPIHIAAVQGEVEIVARLIEIMSKINISIDLTNNLKQTPLHLATITKHAGIVKLLLEAGASPNTPDRKGNTCCHLAVKKNCIECLQVLIESSIEKADIDAKNFEGMTSLHQAVKLGHLDCIKFLICNGAEINIVDGKSGKTPLYLAFECNNKQAADMLLSNGADSNIPTYSGCTLIQAANHRGQKLLKNNNIRTLQGRCLSKPGRRRQRTVKLNT